MHQPFPLHTIAGVFLFSLIFLSCSHAQQPAEAVEAVPQPDQFQLVVKGDYSKARTSLSLLRTSLLDQWNRAGSDSARAAITDSAGVLFTQQLVYDIFPHWMGTTWAFEGHTDIPGTGEVACGYFVSTTLKHAGFNLNRYKLAQQAAFTGCKSLNMGKKPEHIAGKTAPEAVTWFLANKPDGLYTVGLDFHVGFLYKVSGQLYFIHSSYLPPVAVTYENAATSAAFSASESWWITPITHNRPLIAAWLKGDMILISP
ncbi:MAG: hypothetical protein JNM00_03730 [Flavobacteriales bacterium]|nr:hypothetical protein [Flavobacteriales bacterium]